MAATPTPASFSPSSLYVGDLAPEVTENTLYDIFATHVGNVSSIRVCRDANTRRSLGYAYVNFTDSASAENALATLSYSEIMGRVCRLSWSRRDPASRRNAKANLFVKNLEQSIDSKTLHELFSSAGEVTSCKIMTDETGKSRGFAYVNFATAEGAAKAISTISGLVLNDSPVTVMHFVPRKDRGGAAESSYTNVFLKSIPVAWSKDELERFCSEAGKITSAYLAMDAATGASRGFGFVNYASNAEAKAAVEMFNGRALPGQDKPLFAARAMKKAERERQKEESRRKFVNERRSRTQFSNVYVKNLGDEVTDEMLSKAFAEFGSVTSAKVMRNDDGSSKGFGFVCFNSTEEATSAITGLNVRTGVLGSKPLYVALAEVKQQRLEKLHQQSALKVGSYPRGPAAPAGGPGFAAPPYGFPMQFGGAFPPQVRPGYAPGAYPAGAAGAVPGQRAMYPPGAGGRGQQTRMPGYAQPMPGTAMPMQRGAPPAGPPARGDLNAHLRTLTPEARKQFLGENIYPVAREAHGEDAGKITGMLLELDNSELVNMLENPAQLREKIKEAYRVALESQARPTA